jgi:molecular chaperone HscB
MELTGLNREPYRTSLVKTKEKKTNSVKMNYFEFFGIPLSFETDKKELRRIFLSNSKKYHPDFHSMESEQKQAEILEQSTINNEAYKVLKERESRMKYILELKNMIGGEIKASLPQDFLFEMMEINEQIMELQFEYNEAEYKRIEAEVESREQKRDESVKLILENYKDRTDNEKDLEIIRDYYLESRYLKRLKENMQKLI